MEMPLQSQFNIVYGWVRLDDMKLCVPLMGLVPVATEGFAQAWPDKPIQIIVPWPPGAVDVYVRSVQPAIEKELGKPLVIVNRGGANGALGMEQAARAKPDGYTFVFNVTSSAVMVPLTSANATYDIQRDFSPVADFFISPIALVVRNRFRCPRWMN